MIGTLLFLVFVTEVSDPMVYQELAWSDPWNWSTASESRLLFGTGGSVVDGAFFRRPLTSLRHVQAVPSPSASLQVGP